MSNFTQPCKACGKPTDYIIVVGGDIYPCCKGDMKCYEEIKDEHRRNK